MAALSMAGPVLAADPPAAGENHGRANTQADVPGADAARPTEPNRAAAGLQLLNQGRFAEACPMFEKSSSASPASAMLLGLAYCEELSGLLATAWTNYLKAAELAARNGEDEVRDLANERAQQLPERLSTLTLIVPDELVRLPGLKIMRDGTEIERASFNARVPLNGGAHSLEVRAPGRVAWSGLVTLQAEHDDKTLAVPVLELEHAEPPPPKSSEPRHVAAAPAAARDAGGEARRNLQAVSLGLGVGAAAALVVGSTFGILAKVRLDQSNAGADCDRGCDDYHADKRESAIHAADISTWSFVAGGILAAGSLTLYFVSRGASNDSKPTAQHSLRATVAGGVAQLSYGRAF